MNGNQAGYDIDGRETRKRSSDHDNDSGINRKTPGDNVHFKILVPSIAAGAIIGKGGEAIGQIQKETGAKVKMSKANDCYPGTTERVCLILGTVEAITAVHNYIIDRILEKPEQNPRPNLGGGGAPGSTVGGASASALGDGGSGVGYSGGRMNSERHKQVKILVPNSTAGMIIGKGGAFIKEIKDQSGAYVQISQKSTEVNLHERCVTVAGEVDQTRKAACMILEKIAEDPQSASCPNISYAEVTGPVASAFPTGSPYALNSSPSTSAPGGVNAGMSPGGVAGSAAAGIGVGGFGDPMMGATGSLPVATAAMASLNSSLNSSGGRTAFTLDSLRGSLRSIGFAENAVQEIIRAMCVLNNYGFLNMLGLLPPGSPGLTTASTPVPMLHSPGSSFNLGASGGGGAGLMTFQPAHHLEDYTASPLGSAAGPAYHQHPYYAGSTPPDSTGRPGGYTMYTTTGGAATGQAPPPQQHQTAGLGGGGAYMTYGGPPLQSEYHQVGPGGGQLTDDRQLPPPQNYVSRDIEVPDNLVGVILGHQGKALLELQNSTYTSIQISKKGNYSPGTRNRLVTISGAPENVNNASMIIEQHVHQENQRRLYHQQTTPIASPRSVGDTAGAPGADHMAVAMGNNNNNNTTAPGKVGMPGSDASTAPGSKTSSTGK